MALKDFALAADGDLYLNRNGDAEIIGSIRQALQIKLKWFLGEWVFNPDLGVPYFEDILIKNPNQAIIEKDIREQILSVEGVTGIDSLSLSWDRQTRNLSCKFIAQTTEGEIESEVSFNARSRSN